MNFAERLHRANRTYKVAAKLAEYMTDAQIATLVKRKIELGLFARDPAVRDCNLLLVHSIAVHFAKTNRHG